MAPHDGAFGMQRMMEQFETLALGGGGGPGGPGGPDGVDITVLPRPAGPDRERALAPPVPADSGNCVPHNMRPTVNALPNSTALRARWQLPVGVVVRPMGDEGVGREVPVVPLGPQGIVRCRRCRTYMNPFCQWADGGRRFKCNVCTMLNEAPVEYFSTLDASGRRRDSEERPELSCGTVEWVAPTEYMVRPPMPPVFFFVIDVSKNSVGSGLLATAAAAIKASLDSLPGDERTMVGFLTFDTALHFYNLKSTLTAPQMMVVTELDDPFLPLPDDMLVNLRESREVVEALLDSLPSQWPNANLQLPDSCTGAALQAAFLVMSHLGGKMLLFQGSAPTLGAGKFKAREQLAAYGTEREAALRNPEDPFFKRFAAEASRQQITLDVFAAAPEPMDLASWAAIPRYTCGQLYYYPGFYAARDGPRLSADISHNLTRPTAWEAVMRIRCSRGLRISSFHGHFFNRSTDLLALPTCDPDKTFAVQIAHEETMVTGSAGFVQCALLYTSSNGERRIRVHTLCLPITSELGEMYRASDGGAVAALLGKLAVEKALMSKLEDTRAALQAKVSAALKEYRMLVGAHGRQPNALVYPPGLRFLAAHALGLIKSTAFRGSGREVNADERIAALHSLMEAPVEATLTAAYPDVFALHDASVPWGQPADGREGGKVQLPPTVPATLAYMHDSGAYLISNGSLIILWLGRALDPDWVAQVLGPEANSPNCDVSALPLEPPRQGSNLSSRLCALLRALRAGRPASQPAFAVRQGTPAEAVAMPLLVEDRSAGQMAYSDFLVAVLKQVMSK